MSPTIVEPKRGVDMGRLTVEVELENYADWLAAQEGRIESDAIRRMRCEILVDTGATLVCFPSRLVKQLGLAEFGRRPTYTAAGPVVHMIYNPVVVRVQDRECVVSVAELPEECTPLLGQIPLELMDWWVDLTNHRLVGNPEHGGEWQIEV